MRRLNKLLRNVLINNTSLKYEISSLRYMTTISSPSFYSSTTSSLYLNQNITSVHINKDEEEQEHDKEEQENEDENDVDDDDNEDDDDINYDDVSDNDIDMVEFAKVELKDIQFDELNPPHYRAREVDEHGQAHGVGRRKNAIARVWIKPGVGQVKVNHMDVSEYFDSLQRNIALEAFQVSETAGYFDVWCLAHGGGKVGKLFRSNKYFIYFIIPLLLILLYFHRPSWSCSSWFSKSFRSI